MAIDTPARIAVLGAGPIGLEAALYARYLGYDVDLYERGTVAEHVEQWGHVRMFTPFGLNRSTLGLAALKAQDPDWIPPDDTEVLTGRQYRARYLLPLAKSDLLVDSIHERTEVLAVGREGWLKTEGPESEGRADSDFRLLLRVIDVGGHVHERFATAQAVLDTTGTYAFPNWLGPDGMPALGEMTARSHVEYGLPDVRGAARDRYAGRNILLIGDGDSAVTTLVALAELASQTSDTWITWVTRGVPAPPPAKPAALEELIDCQRIHEQALRLAADDSNHVTHLPNTAVESIVWHSDLERFAVRLTGKETDEREFDRVIANVGYRGHTEIFEELQVDRVSVVGAPRRKGSFTSEPDFYVLGAKSWGRDGRFRIVMGHAEIREVFSVIGDRADLDLYSTMGKLA